MGASPGAHLASAPTPIVPVKDAPLVSGFSVNPSSYGVKISLNTSKPALVRVSYGADAPVIWSAPDGPDLAHLFKIHGLAPDTNYTAWVSIIPLSGPSKTQTVSFHTDAYPLHPKASIGGGDVLMNGEPFFPIMSLATCVWDSKEVYRAGVNLVITDNTCGGLDGLISWNRGNAFSAGSYNSSLAGGDGVVGWYLGDEPDGRMVFPEDVSTPPVSDSRINILTLTEHVARQAARLEWERPGMYADYIKKADFIGFDAYPLQSHCSRDYLGTVYDYQADVAAQAAPKPTFQWIEVGGMEFCPGNEPTTITPQTVHNEIWQAIAGGAHGLGIFPTTFIPSVGDQLAIDTKTISALSPVILSPTVPVQLTQKSRVVKASARVYNGATYIIIANASFDKASADVKLPGLGSVALSSYGGTPSDTVQTKDDSFSVSLDPLGVKIFILAPNDM